jgi:hypothetical protein
MTDFKEKEYYRKSHELMMQINAQTEAEMEAEAEQKHREELVEKAMSLLATMNAAIEKMENEIRKFQFRTGNIDDLIVSADSPKDSNKGA